MNLTSKLFKTDEIGFNKILVSKTESYGTKKLFKYSICYDDNDVNRPLFIQLP